MKPVLSALCMLLLALPLAAFDPGPVAGDRIAVVVAPPSAGIGSYLARSLARELDEAGYDAEVVFETVDDLLAHEPAADYYLEIVFADAEGRPTAGIGTGGTIGSVGVGAEVGVVVAWVEAEVRVYNATSGRLLDHFAVDARRARPALTHVAIGDRHGFLSVGVPIFASLASRAAARELAREIGERVTNREDSVDGELER